MHGVHTFKAFDRFLAFIFRRPLGPGIKDVGYTPLGFIFGCGDPAGSDDHRDPATRDRGDR